jgi:hypothetical protein
VREGKRDSEIAVILGLSSRTVEKHVGHILEKLGVETRTAAVNECHSSLALSQTAFKTSQPAFSFGHTGKSLIQESDK